MLSHEIEEDFDGIDYDGEFEMNTLSTMLDLHPFENGFHVSGGAYFGDKVIDLVATPTTLLEIGNATFTPAQIGELHTRVEFENAAPYLGIGYDNFAFSDKALTFNTRLGVMFVGEPHISLTSTGGTISTDPLVIAEIANEEQNLNDELSDLQYMPVVSIGATYRF